MHFNAKLKLRSTCDASPGIRARIGPRLPQSRGSGKIENSPLFYSGKAKHDASVPAGDGEDPHFTNS